RVTPSPSKRLRVSDISPSCRSASSSRPRQGSGKAEAARASGVVPWLVPDARECAGGTHSRGDNDARNGDGDRPAPAATPGDEGLAAADPGQRNPAALFSGP